MNYCEPARRQGKMLMQAIVLRSVIEPTGLPKTNLIFCRSKYMVKWNCKTGEVSSIPYHSSYKSIDKNGNWF